VLEKDGKSHNNSVQREMGPHTQSNSVFQCFFNHYVRG